MSTRELADAAQAQAIAIVNQMTDALRAMGWDFAAVSVARGVLLADGTATLPGASTFEAHPAILPALPSIADNLRALARELDAYHAASGCRERADGYTHVLDSVAVRRKRPGGYEPPAPPPPAPDRLRLADTWNAFDRDAIPPSARVGQRRGMRHAFYAGAACLLDELAQCDESSGQQVADELAAELSQFADDVKAGKA